MTYGLAQSQDFLHASEIVRVKQVTKPSHEHDAIASTPNAAASMKDIKWMGVNGQKPTVKGKAYHPHLPTLSISNRLLASSILESNQVFQGRSQNF